MRYACIFLMISLICNPLFAAEALKICTPLAEVFERGVLARNVQLNGKGDAIILYDLNLIEDDGPGACSGNQWWDQSTQDIICHGQSVKKVLMVDHPEAMACHLSISTTALKGETRPLKIQINPKTKPPQDPVMLEPGVPQWQAIPIKSGILVNGENEIIFSCDGTVGWEINIAKREDIERNAPDRESVEPRSFKLIDGGERWSDQLGKDHLQSGEYQVRLTMEQYLGSGILESPVIDLAVHASGGSIIAHPVRIDFLKLVRDADIPPKTAILFEIRSSAEPDIASPGWSDWRMLGPDGSIFGSLDRFIQWRATLQTEVATLTPTLNKVEIESRITVAKQPWTEGVTVADSHNEEISYTSIPFEYEKFDEARLVELREKYKLDEVVAGTENELEKMIKLRNWVSRQWKYDPPMPPYPAWDAHEILERRKGFCVQYAIVYMQCALSLGMQTRFVFGNFPHTHVDGKFVAGHEVDEFWSNDYGKWIMMDANQDECFVDRSTGIPLNMLELHEELLDLYYGDQLMDLSGRDFSGERKSGKVQIWKSDEPAPQEEPPVMRLKWGTVRWMPRNNFYAHRFPEPIAQGRVTWSWTGYWQWEDQRTGRELRFPRFTFRRADIEWTLNQAHFTAAYLDEPGEIEIKMATVTPDLDTLQVQLDDGEWKASGDTFQWILMPGRNRLQMRSRNRAGVVGRPSWLELDYTAK